MKNIYYFQEQKKSKILQESMLKLDAEMKRTDSLLYQMIPKPVADRLRRGEPAISTCEVSVLSVIYLLPLNNYSYLYMYVYILMKF